MEWTAEFADGIRKIRDATSDEELRESMKAFGWVPELPAVRDEHGTVVMGHRRLRIAEELSIEPNVKDVEFGSGTEADAQRFALAIASNVGFAPMVPRERTAIAKYLGARGWTVRAIGAALNVHHSTIAKDLEGSCLSDRQPPRPQGGRPRGTRGATKVTPEIEARIRELLLARHGSQQEIANLVSDEFYRQLHASHPSDPRISVQPVKMIWNTLLANNEVSVEEPATRKRSSSRPAPQRVKKKTAGKTKSQLKPSPIEGMKKLPRLTPEEIDPELEEGENFKEKHGQVVLQTAEQRARERFKEWTIFWRGTSREWLKQRQEIQIKYLRSPSLSDVQRLEEAYAVIKPACEQIAALLVTAKAALGLEELEQV